MKVYVFLYQNLNTVATIPAVAAYFVYVFLYQNLNFAKWCEVQKKFEFMYFYIRI